MDEPEAEDVEAWLGDGKVRLCENSLTLPLQQQRVSGQTIAVFVLERGYKPLLCLVSMCPLHFLLNSQVTLEPDTKK